VSSIAIAALSQPTRAGIAIHPFLINTVQAPSIKQRPAILQPAAVLTSKPRRIAVNWFYRQMKKRTTNAKGQGFDERRREGHESE
jgi:hypothetical protein